MKDIKRLDDMLGKDAKDALDDLVKTGRMKADVERKRSKQEGEDASEGNVTPRLSVTRDGDGFGVAVEGTGIDIIAMTTVMLSGIYNVLSENELATLAWSTMAMMHIKKLLKGEGEDE